MHILVTTACNIYPQILNFTFLPNQHVPFQDHFIPLQYSINSQANVINCMKLMWNTVLAKAMQLQWMGFQKIALLQPENFQIQVLFLHPYLVCKLSNQNNSTGYVKILQPNKDESLHNKSINRIRKQIPRVILFCQL